MRETDIALAYANRQLRYWQSRIATLSAASDALASDAKETEAEKRDIPPTPPIERKGEEKERASSITTACARATDCDAALTKHELRLLHGSPLPEHRELYRSYVANIPTIARAVAHAQLMGCFDAAFVRKWYDCMDMSCWADSHGNPIQNWCHLLMRWIENRAYFDKLQDPNRIPDTLAGGGRAGAKPINWRGTRKEDLDGFLA